MVFHDNPLCDQIATFKVVERSFSKSSSLQNTESFQKFRTLIACQNGQDKQRRPRSDYP